ncbi:MAG: Mg(2+) transport ATPase protein [Labilithrix sp.]|nr:Mg(2+) transport ATPase protein [Labilithrix sp.]
MLAHSEMILRMAAGGALGGVIGFERGRHARQVGLRTHLIVALAAATFMVVSSQFTYYQQFVEDELIEVDASRIAASVVSAIGFLAGGAILRSGLTVLGLTTAAGLWLVTAIGLCAGAGMYVESVTATAMGLTVLTVLRRFEKRTAPPTLRKVSIVLAGGGEVGPLVMRALSELGVTVADADYERRLEEERETTLTLDVSVPHEVPVPTLLEALEKYPGVKRIQISKVPEDLV